MKFLHLTDTHYLKSDHEAAQQMLEQLAKQVAFECLDFVVHTGDLTNDGDEADYQALKDLMEATFPKDLPIYYCLGNHDLKRDYNKVFEGKDTSDLHYFTVNHRGYRIIILDTSIEGLHDGEVKGDQAEWLFQELSEPSEKGTLIFQHHPYGIGWAEGVAECKVETGFFDRLKQSDVLAIFTGHLHMQRNSLVEGIPQYSANSTRFGITLYKKQLWISDRTGYSLVSVSDGLIDYYPEILVPNQTPIDKYLG